MKKTYYIFPLLLIFFICTGRIYGDSFRVRKTVEVEVPPSGTVVCSAGIYDALAIKLPKDTTFLQGIELEIKIPEVISRYRGSVAYSLYTDVTPVPTKKTIDYTGTQQYLDVIPSKLSMILTIPLIEYDKSKDPYTETLPLVYDLQSPFVFLRFQLVMKGIPENYDSENFSITVKPIYQNKGIMSLEVQYPLNQNNEVIQAPYTVYIDDKQVTLDNNRIILTSGLHYVSIVSDSYRNETRTFTIEQAKTTQITVALRDVAPTLQFVAPNSAQIYLDNILVEEPTKEMIISQGEHSIRIVVGDYEVVKVLQAMNGRSYTIHTQLDVDIEETP